MNAPTCISEASHKNNSCTPCVPMFFLQSPKPKTGIFCFLIHEARPATELELPGGENVFVIKVCIVLYMYVTGKSNYCGIIHMLALWEQIESIFSCWKTQPNNPGQGLTPGLVDLDPVPCLLSQDVSLFGKQGRHGFISVSTVLQKLVNFFSTDFEKWEMRNELSSCRQAWNCT